MKDSEFAVFVNGVLLFSGYHYFIIKENFFFDIDIFNGDAIQIIQNGNIVYKHYVTPQEENNKPYIINIMSHKLMSLLK